MVITLCETGKNDGNVPEEPFVYLLNVLDVLGLLEGFRRLHSDDCVWSVGFGTQTPDNKEFNKHVHVYNPWLQGSVFGQNSKNIIKREMNYRQQVIPGGKMGYSCASVG